MIYHTNGPHVRFENKDSSPILLAFDDKGNINLKINGYSMSYVIDGARLKFANVDVY